MPSRLAARSRRKCFISYYHSDANEVTDFVDYFDHDRDVLISRGIGASMTGDIINSSDAGYIMRRVREEYLTDSTVTIVLVGRCTWARKYVDWEIGASLRNNPSSGPSGLVSITLPSAAGIATAPARLADNLDGEDGYARWWKYPTSADSLARMIENAYTARQSRVDRRVNSRALFSNNRTCFQ